MKPIINAHASAGSGHRSVSRAINNCLERDFGATTLLADSLGFAGPGFRRTYGKGYEFSAQHMHWLCKLVYTLTDKPASERQLTALVEWTTSQRARSLFTFVRENNIDVVCCTHYLPVALLGRMKRQGLYQGKVVACVTDFQVHGFWADQGMDHFFVPTPEARERLLSWGYSPERITVSGIPVRTEFAEVGARSKNAPEAGRLRVLFSASAIKVREAKTMLRELEDSGLNIELTVICGRNDELRKALQSYRPGPKLSFDLHGFEQNMEDFMAESDLMITKPGGITCTEGLCAGLPMLFVSPIPMHEVYNAELIAGAGGGILCFEKGRLGRAVKELGANPARLTDMRRACLDYAHPDAGEKIAAHLAALAKAGG